MKTDQLQSSRCFLSVKEGVLSLDFNADPTELWLNNSSGTFRIFPGEEECSSQLPLPFPEDEPIDVTAKYRRRFIETLEAIAPFVSEKHSLAIFCLRHGAPALELIKDCPGLVYMLATSSFYGLLDDMNDSSRITPEEKRKILLPALEYPGSKSAMRILRKVPATECSWELFYDLRALLSTRDTRLTKMLCHLERVNHLLVKLLSEESLRPYLAMSLLEEVATLSAGDDRVWQCCEVMELVGSIDNGVEAGLKITPLRAVSDFEVLHQNIIGWLRNGHAYDRLKNLTLPSPPFPEAELSMGDQGIARVIPLSSGEALWEEGEKMHHCLAGYADAIVLHNGTRYAYHLELPDGEQATMLIDSQGGRWEIVEIRGRCNADVTDKMMLFALNWVKQEL